MRVACSECLICLSIQRDSSNPQDQGCGELATFVDILLVILHKSKVGQYSPEIVQLRVFNVKLSLRRTEKELQ